MGRRLVLVVAFAAMFVLFAAMVTPFVATPLSLTHGKRVADAAHLMVVPACALLARTATLVFRPETAPAISLSGVNVIRFTCARIC
ncbi:MAG TPA: hypothetical protein VD837_15125 [Terriglobales bacterium]|nr:hypothetical protein [Terriglobales bacterium]